MQKEQLLNKRSSQIIILIAVTIACLVPFAGKAFHIDDPLFLWTARQIQSHPLDPYGFDVTWSVTSQKMSDVTKNPPLNSYYIALIASIFGWGEIPMHLAFLVPAIAAVLGSYFIAIRLTSRPLLAALITLLTPVFIVSATSVMCDVMMLAFWVWAVFLWIKGIDEDSSICLAGSAVLVALALVTKYFGASLILLLGSYAAYKKRSAGPWLFYLVIPIAAILSYQMWTKALYGRGLMTDAGAYAYKWSSEEFAVKKALIGLGFAGGCMLSAVFFAPFLWSRKTLAAGCGAVAILTFLISKLPRLENLFLYDASGVRWNIVIQCAFFAVVGAALISLAVSDFLKKRDASSLLLLLWLVGTFIFAAFVNWSVNSRSILPMAPAAAILISRRLDLGYSSIKGLSLFLLIPAAALSLAVAASDHDLAQGAKRAAHEIYRKYGADPSTVWVQGHWGFQYYMQLLGARETDIFTIPNEVRPGDIMAISGTGESKMPIPVGLLLRPVETIDMKFGHYVSTMNGHTGAGFYASGFGPLPFVMGRVPDEEYYVFRALSNAEELNRIMALLFKGFGDDQNAKDIFNYTMFLMNWNPKVGSVSSLAQIFRKRGKAYMAREDYGRAISDFSQAILLAPFSSGDLYSLRAAAYMKKGENNMAEGDIDRMRELNLGSRNQ